MNRIIGVLWKKEKDGKEYYSGVLRDLHGDINIAVFPNTKKEAENQPDMNIVLSFWYKKDEDDTDAEKTKTNKKPGRKKSNKPDDEEEIPF